MTSTTKELNRQTILNFFSAKPNHFIQQNNANGASISREKQIAICQQLVGSPEKSNGQEMSTRRHKEDKNSSPTNSNLKAKTTESTLRKPTEED